MLVQYLSNKVLEKVKAQLHSRGARTIRGIGRVFRSLDSYDGNRKVDPEEFFVGLNELGCDLTRDESKVSLNLILLATYECFRY